jgi:hypothetical protein
MEENLRMGEDESPADEVLLDSENSEEEVNIKFN